MAYYRVSDPGQVATEYDPEGMSLPTQRRICAEKARSKHLNLVDELIDAGVTATTTIHRKSYKDLLERIRNDESISFVMVYSISRLHRNWPEAGQMMQELSNHGVYIISAMEDIDFRTDEGLLMLGVMFSLHGYQSSANSKDLRDKMTQKALVGGTPGWVPPGYENVREKFEGRSINTVAIDLDRAPFIPLAFEWFATGHYTYDDLREKLNEAGMRSRPNKSKPAGLISRGMVEDMLRNRYYLGYVTFSGVEYKGRHEPLVSQELFDRVQQVLANMPGAGNRQRRYHHYLKGLLWCARCHRRLIIMRGKSKTGELYFYYVCRGRQDRQCKLPYARVSHVEEAVANHYLTVDLPAAFRQMLLDGFERAVEYRDGGQAQHKKQLRKRLAQLDQQEDRYIELVVDPDWPKDKIKDKLRAIRDERARVETSLTETTEQLLQGHHNAKRILDYLTKPQELYARSGIRTRTVLNRIVFSKLKMDISDQGIHVAGDELLEPFASVIYLRRERSYNENGGLPRGETAVNDRVLALLREAFPKGCAQSSSNSALAEDRVSGFMT